MDAEGMHLLDAARNSAIRESAFLGTSVAGTCRTLSVGRLPSGMRTFNRAGSYGIQRQIVHLPPERSLTVVAKRAETEKRIVACDSPKTGHQPRAPINVNGSVIQKG